MAGQTIRFFNLTGGLNTEQGMYTINSTSNRTESPEMKNIEYYKLSGLKVQAGNTLLGNLDSHTVIGGYEYHQGNQYYLVVATNMGDVYIYDDTYKKFTKIYSYDKVCETIVFCNYAEGLVISNAQDNLVYYVKDREQQEQTNLFNIVNTLSVVNEKYTITRAKASTVDEISYTALGIGDRIYLYNSNGSKLFNIPFEIVEINGVDDITKEQETMVVSPVGTLEGTFTGKARIKLSDISLIGENLHNTDPNNLSTNSGRIIGNALANYKGRLWVANPDGGIYYSELGNIHGWDIYLDAGVISESEEDKSLVTALGIWSEYLVVHKKTSTYLLNATDSNSENWEYKPYTESTCRGQYSFISNDRGYFLYSDKNQGIYPLLSRSVYNTTYMGKELSYKIRSSFINLDTTKQDQIFVAYDPVKQYMCFYMNMLDGNGYSNKCYIYNFLTQSWLYRELPQNVTIAFSCNNKIYIGTYEGDVLEEFKGSTFNGENIPFSWTSPEYTWGGGTNKTTTKEVRFKLSNEENNNFLVESILDGSRTTERKRKVSINEAGKTLVWDIGYNLEDRNSLGSNQDVYRYKATETDDVYYSLSEPETVKTKINIPMYKTSDCSDTPVNNQTITYTTTGTPSNYSSITYTQSSVYGWQNQDLEYQAYKYNDFIAWVKKGDTTGKCLINLTTKTTSELEWVGFGGAQIATNQPRDYVYCRVSANFYNNYWNTPNAQGEAQLLLNGTWASDSENAYIKVLNTKDPTGGGYAYNGKGRGTIMVVKTTGASLWYSQIQDRQPAYDTYKDVTKEVSNGRTDSTNAVERAYTKSGDNIIIKINDTNCTFTRNTSYDYGNPLDTPKYTEVDYPKAGDKVYQDSTLSIVYDTIKSRDGNKLYLNDNSNIILYKNTSYDATKQIPHYWQDKAVTWTTYYYDDGYPYKVTFVGESYPDEDDPVWIESITDTTFDNDLWAGSGYVTKRCILSNQYFETIQYRFYGETNGTSLCLAGFEVDGIQITEVPH